MRNRKIVAIFGSSRVKPDSELYQSTYALAHALASEDYVVMSGGYEGVMEAASKGAADAGGHVIGVSAAPLEKLRRVKPNEWIKQVIPFDSVHERLAYMVVTADAYVVMPGGAGHICGVVDGVGVGACRRCAAAPCDMLRGLLAACA